ncbi:MAG: DOMON-like domain-containing protein [Vulcanococcus sp.]
MLKLVPFQAIPAFADLQLHADLHWEDGELRLRYQLQAPVDLVQLPGPVSQPKRRHELWQTTCFEAFIAVAGSPHYWEINLASTEDWNVYELDDYRTGLKQEERVETITIQQQRDCSAGQLQLELSAQLKLDGILESGQQLEGSLTAVLDAGDHGLSYWALEHRGNEADFHRRDSFCWRS